MRERALEIAKLEGALDYGYYDLDGSHGAPQQTNESDMLRRELWEAHAPPEWVDGDCPHRYFDYRGCLTLQAAQPCFLFWCLTETKKLRMIEELVREAETRYRAWVCTHLKRPAYDPSTYVHRWCGLLGWTAIVSSLGSFRSPGRTA
jgi:hypothetical protein